MSEELGSILDYSMDIADAEAPRALPAGDYPAKIVAAELGTSQNSGKRRVDVTFRILPEDFPADYEDADSFADGKDIHYYIGAEGDKASMFRMRKFCEAIGAPTSSRLDINDWIGKSAMLTIEPDEYEGVERERARKVEAK
jgi:hypothetical protein